MKSYLKVLLLTTLFLSITSCGGEKKSSTEFSIDISALSGSGANASGGLMLIGHRVDDSAIFSKSFKSSDSDPILELDNGKWEFYLSYWNGATPLTGSAFCAYSGPYELNGSETKISFQTSKSNCAQPIADGTYASYDANASDDLSFPTFTISTCLNNASSCSLNGLTKSFYVSLTSENKNTNIQGPGELKSNCIVPGDLLTLPTGEAPGNGGGIFKPIIYLFTSTDCTGPAVVYEFKDGIQKNFTDTYIKSQYNFSGSTVNLRVVHNLNSPRTNISNITFEQFGTGDDGSSPIGTQTISDFGKIVNIPNQYSVELNSSQGSNFSIGQEIMWYVTEETNAGSDCGGTIKPGHFGFQRIKNITGDSLEFYENLRPSAIALPSGSYLISGLCSMQIARVYNYQSIDLGSEIIGLAYNSIEKRGGILAMRVRDTLKMQDNSSIKSFGTGFINSSPNVNGYAHCIDGAPPCLKMGKGNGTFSGGGVTFVTANKLEFNHSASTASIHSSANDGDDGGDTLVTVNELKSNTYALDNSNISSNGSTGLAGRARIFYCKNTSSPQSFIKNFDEVVDNGGNPVNSELLFKKNSLLCQ